MSRWLFFPTAVSSEQLVVTNAYSSTSVGGVESSIFTDVNTTVYSAWTFGWIYCTDANKDGSWTNDGNGFIWNQQNSTTVANWAGYLGTSGGTFKIYETGTSTEIFTFAWGSYGQWSSSTYQYARAANAYTGTVPSSNQRVDIYHVPV